MGRGQVTHIFSGMLEARGTVDGKGSKMDPLMECGALGFCPSCLAVMPVQRLLEGMGGLPAMWLSGGLYTCFSSL